MSPVNWHLNDDLKSLPNLPRARFRCLCLLYFSSLALSLLMQQCMIFKPIWTFCLNLPDNEWLHPSLPHSKLMELCTTAAGIYWVPPRETKAAVTENVGLAREMLLIALGKEGWWQWFSIPRGAFKPRRYQVIPQGKLCCSVDFLADLGVQKLGLFLGVGDRCWLDSDWMGFGAAWAGGRSPWQGWDWMSFKLPSKPFYDNSMIPGCGFLSQPSFWDDS